MKVLFLTNNENSHGLYTWLKEVKNEEVILFSERCTFEDVKRIKPEIIISYNYRFIINQDIISFISNRIINLHVSLLPWNRGAHPNVWSFLEDTPKGVTIHLIDEGLDTGDILVQKEVHFDEETETLKTSYNKLHMEIQDLFKENWEALKSCRIKPSKQSGKGSIHFIKEFEKIKQSINFEGWNISIKQLKKRYKEIKR